MATRPAKGRNDRLGRLVTEAGMSREGLAQRVNDLGALMGVEVRYDYTYVYRWIEKGQRPRDPAPHLIATVLARTLGRPVSVEEIGLGDDSRPVNPLSVEDIGIGADSDGTSVMPSRADAGPVSVAAGPGVAVSVAVSVDGIPVTGGTGAYGVWVVLAGPLPLTVNAEADDVAQGPGAAGRDGARVYWLADERRRRGGRAG